MQNIVYAVAIFIAYTNGLAIGNVDDAELDSTLVTRDNLDITSPFHKCLLGGQAVDACLAQAGLTSPNPKKRGVLGTISSALGTINWDGASFSGEETCYKGLKDKYSWVKLVDVNSAIGGACDNVVPTVLKAAGAGTDYKHATWQSTIQSLAYPNYKVPIYLTLAVKGADLYTQGKFSDMASQACKDAVTHLLKDKNCLSNQEKNDIPNGGQVVRTFKPGNILQTILELGDINGPQDTCNTHYKFVLDSFEIKGKKFDSAKIGADGDLLKKQVSGCGALTKWKFSNKPTDDGFEWSASGQLPIATKACLGRAIKTVGGTDTCSGST